MIKSAEQTPASILLLTELIADLLPPGVVNVVNGFGVEAGNLVDEATMIGAQASSDQHEKILSYIDVGRQEGAQVLAGGGPRTVMFHQSGGCCDGSSPMCYPRAEFQVGAADVLLGHLARDTPFWMSAAQYTYWEHTHLTVDVVPGRGSGFSLDAPPRLNRVNTYPKQPDLGRVLPRWAPDRP